ncbi:hypothetical protein CBFG_04568 [Clostridiales bacterium 1_7_47FAA]|nr:hypothetical protein CBFG_04568 [Clostridiales bacterium 1_7_47FAA]
MGRYGVLPKACMSLGAFLYPEKDDVFGKRGETDGRMA